ncbi:MAG: YciI family protein [Thermomicrobiales bacterium]
MRFLCIVYGCDGPQPAGEEDSDGPMMREVIEQVRALAATGHLIAASPLDHPSTAVTVQVRDSGVTLTDGPFAETKEHVGGFYLINAESLEEAVQFATEMPPARIGAIEVRPLVEIMPDRRSTA